MRGIVAKSSRSSRTSERSPLRRPNGMAGAAAKGALATRGDDDEHSHLSHLGSDAVAHGMVGRFMRDTLEDTHHDAAYNEADDGDGSSFLGGHEGEHTATSFRSAARKLQSKASEIAIKVRAWMGSDGTPRTAL